MGCHPGGPSIVNIDHGELSLSELISGDAHYYLGKKVKEEFGSLPFLFKLLAAEKPLSIQAHPNLSQAQEGYQREAGLALDAPHRSYKDPNHKPEIICSITPFTGMCGFREPGEIRDLLIKFIFPQRKMALPAAVTEAGRTIQNIIEPLFIMLEKKDTGEALKDFLSALFKFSPEERNHICRYILHTGPECLEDGLYSADNKLPLALWKTMIRFAELFPDDPALLSPLYLNLFELKPGEALFLHAGTLHAYINGFGIELMANSDNVLRGGLTPKHIDQGELMRILNFIPVKPEIIRPPANAGQYTYPVQCRDFALSVIRGNGEKNTAFQMAPAICIVTSGELEVSGKAKHGIIKTGESIFISHSENPLFFGGKFTLYAASIPL